MAKKVKTLPKKAKKVVQSTASKTTSNKTAQSNTAANLHTAEAKLSKALDMLKNLTARVETARNKAKVSAQKAKQNGRAASVNVAKRANDTVKVLMTKRKDAASKVKLAREVVREAKQKLRQEEQQKRLIERKEIAKQKAVVTFIKKWEREWDRKMKSLEKGRRKPEAAAA
jgi:hypothetical protein